uniref:Geranylgeranyl transferase type-2 subunit alpha n=1 Tax=Panagrolaimus sp. ES5 TaxID=591445 RepID=A0AC34GUE7_9BILA
MHSIKKVEESARIAREAKRQKKCHEVDALRKKIFATFKNIDGHEREFLDLSEIILKSIPDLYTFWIMRRNVLLKIKQKMEADPSYTIFHEDEITKLAKKKGLIPDEKVSTKEIDEEVEEKSDAAAGGDASSVPNPEVLEANFQSFDATEPYKKPELEEFMMEKQDNDESKIEESTKETFNEPLKPKCPLPTFDDLLDRDTKLSEEALFHNPKSYSAWNHRRFLMELYSNPPLKREIEICEKALTFDSRNFHVWDYRRYIVQLLNRTMDEELEFSKKMVEKNPSNYSAWHYRINILLEAGGEITDEMFVDEIRNVTEVCVVNSEDQTAWTYVNWLIDRFFNQKETKKGLENVISFTDNEMVDGNYHSTLVLYNSCTTEELKKFIEIDINNQEWKPRGKTTTVNLSNISSRIWDIYSKASINLFDSKLKETSDFSLVESPKRRYINSTLLNKIYSPNPKEMSPEVEECLKTFYKICQELMRDNEESNPWEICLSAFVLPLISGINNETEIEVKYFLEKAKTCDPQRKEMYDATANQIILTNLLQQKIDDGKNTVLEKLFEKEGKLCLEFNDYSCLRPLAGLIRLYNSSSTDLPFVIQAQLCLFLPVIAN